MTAPQITQTISQFAGDLPDKDTMTPDEFDLAAEAWVAHWATLITQINAWATQANAIGVSANDLLTALASANFAGRWSDLTGALSVPAAVYHDEQYWMLLDDLADVTASEPGPANADWALIALGNEVITVNESDDVRVITVSEAIRGVTFSNVGAAGNCNLELPPPAAGYMLHFYSATAHGFGSYTNSIPIRWGAQTQAAGAGGAGLWVEAIGVFWTLRAFDANEWVITNLQGAVVAYAW